MSEINKADFTPDLGNYKTLQPFRYWCQKVLPLVYDDSLSYYELLCKVVDYLNKAMEDVETLNGDVTGLHDAYVKLQDYVNDYFDSLDVQEEINNKLDGLVINGTLTNLLRQAVNPSPIMVDDVAKMTNQNTIYVLSTSGSLYYYNGVSFVDSGLSYTNNENYLSRSLNELTSDIATNLREIPTNRAYAITSNTPDIFPVKGVAGYLLKVSPLNRDGFSSYTLITENNNYFGFDNGDNVVWTRINMYKDNTVYTSETFASKFGNNFANYNGDAVICCNGNIPSLGISLNGTYTIVAIASGRETVGFNVYFAISNTFTYIGFNTSDRIVWTNSYVKNNITYTAETFVTEFGENFANYNNNAIICCNGNIPALGINLNGLYTIIAICSRDGIGYNAYFAISDTFTYIGFNTGGAIVWNNLLAVNTNINDSYISNLSEKNIVICGDSIVAGVGGTGYSATGEPIGNIPIHGEQQHRNDNGQCWANSLCSYLKNNYNVSTAINNGISGINTQELSDNISQIIPTTTDIAIISIGVNDRSTIADINTTINNIKNIGAYCVLNDIKPIFLTLIQSVVPYGDYHNNYELNDAIHTACNGKYSCFNVFSSLNEYLDIKNIELNTILTDGLHPNDNGYNILFKIIKYLLGI